MALLWPSEFRLATRGIDLPSPELFNKLGVCGLLSNDVVLAVLMRGVRLLREFPPTSTVILLVEGFEFIDVAFSGRDPTVGGWGKAPMLTVLRTVFSSAATLPSAELDLSVGISEVEPACCNVGSIDGREVARGGRSLEEEEVTGKLFLGDFCLGIGGRADVGGSPNGREKRGSCGEVGIDITAAVVPQCSSIRLQTD